MEKSYLTISALNERLNSTLEEGLGQVSFSGEIHQITRATSGHLYMELKDSDSKVSAVMWRGVAQGLSFVPGVGQEVLCSGRPNVYQRSGRLQMIVVRMEPAGEGALQLKFLALKAALEKEGLFQIDRKRPLPFLPLAIGIVTSQSGAAIHDMVVKLNERMPSVQKYLIDTRVQGEGAAKEIAVAIETFNRMKNVEVIIIGRGGGSLEDLWAFNEEVVVRAVFASEIPVISAVGHEVDVTLSDLVADVRAPTPTAAAEMVVPQRAELLRQLMESYRRLADYNRWLQPHFQTLDELGMSLTFGFRREIQRIQLRVENAHSRVRAIEPGNRLKFLGSKLEENERRFASLMPAIFSVRRNILASFAQRFNPEFRRREVQNQLALLTGLESRLESGLQGEMRKANDSLLSISKLLDSVSPRRVLERGFAIVRHRNEIVRSTDMLQVADRVAVTLGVGTFEAEVKSCAKNEG